MDPTNTPTTTVLGDAAKMTLLLGADDDVHRRDVVGTEEAQHLQCSFLSLCEGTSKY